MLFGVIIFSLFILTLYVDGLCWFNSRVKYTKVQILTVISNETNFKTKLNSVSVTPTKHTTYSRLPTLNSLSRTETAISHELGKVYKDVQNELYKLVKQLFILFKP